MPNLTAASLSYIFNVTELSAKFWNHSTKVMREHSLKETSGE